MKGIDISIGKHWFNESTHTAIQKQILLYKWVFLTLAWQKCSLYFILKTSQSQYSGRPQGIQAEIQKYILGIDSVSTLLAIQ